MRPNPVHRPTMKNIQLGNRVVGDGAPVFVIAEAGVNHNGDVRLALELVDAAARVGADAVKFQAFVTDEVVTSRAEKAAYQIATTGSSGSQREMLKALELSPADHRALQTRCEERSVVYLCTPYDEPSVEMLDGLGVPAFKIASTDTTNVPLLRRIAAKSRPVLLSTGMSTLAEVETAVGTLKRAGLDGKIVLLQCTSEYPAPAREANLRAMRTMREAFECPVGFSDHTEGIEVAVWAVAAGACVIEKHFTLDRTMKGPDHPASLEPAEFGALVRAARHIEEVLGTGVKQLMPSERSNTKLVRRSLVAQRHIAAGAVLTADDLACKRPANGLSPAWFDRVVGQVAAVDIAPGEAFTLTSVKWKS